MYEQNSEGRVGSNQCTGDADGLGETRKTEWVKSGISLGLRKEDDVFVVESPYVLSSEDRWIVTDIGIASSPIQ